MKKILLFAILIATSLCMCSQVNSNVKKNKSQDHGYLPYDKNKKSDVYDCSDFGFGKSRYGRKTFVTLNFSYSMKPSTAMGVTFGMIRRIGWFASVMCSSNLKSFNTNGEFNRDNTLETKPFLKGDSHRIDTRLSLMAGLLVRVVRKVALSFGVGYGIDENCYETTDGQWFKDKVNCEKGFDTSLGIQCYFKHVVVSTDAVMTDFHKLEAKIGIGYSF